MVEEQAAQQQKEEIIIMIISQRRRWMVVVASTAEGSLARSFVLMSLQSRALDVSPVGSVQFDSILSRRAHCKCMAIV